MSEPNVLMNNPELAGDTTEQDLIARVQRGQHELFYELVRPYERRVYAAALAILRNEADAEDVATALEVVEQLGPSRAAPGSRESLLWYEPSSLTLMDCGPASRDAGGCKR